MSFRAQIVIAFVFGSVCFALGSIIALNAPNLTGTARHNAFTLFMVLVIPGFIALGPFGFLRVWSWWAADRFLRLADYVYGSARVNRSRSLMKRYPIYLWYTHMDENLNRRPWNE